MVPPEEPTKSKVKSTEPFTPAKQLRLAKKQYADKKTYENYLDVQMAQRNLVDYRITHMKVLQGGKT